MQVTEFLEKSGVSYEITEHKPTFTAQTMAAAEHEPGKYVAKPVIVKADGKYVMCVLSANHKIDMQSLKSQIGAETIELAEEKEIATLCSDCETGAEAPFGNLYNIATVMDKALAKDDHITFQGGSHEKAIRMSMDDYRKLAEPKLLDFSYHIIS